MSAQSDLISQQSDQLYQSINSPDYASAVMCHGFGCGFNQEVFLAITSKTSGKTQVIQEWDKVGTAA